MSRKDKLIIKASELCLAEILYSPVSTGKIYVFQPKGWYQVGDSVYITPEPGSVYLKSDGRWYFDKDIDRFIASECYLAVFSSRNEYKKLKIV